MPRALTRLPLETALLIGLAATLVVFALGSSTFDAIVEPARVARWIVLAAVALLAVAAARGRFEVRPPGLPELLASALLVLAFLSTAWSGAPWLSFRRAVALALAFVLGLALARTLERRRIAWALVAGGSVLVLGGALLVLVASDEALQAATTQTPSRFRGLGENPNTLALLYALLLPPAAWLAVAARSARERGAAVLAAFGLAASIVASGSRGAAGAAVAAVLLLALVGARGRRRALAVAGTLAAFALGIAITEVPQPLSVSPPTAAPVAAPGPVPGYDSPLVENDPNEIGRPRAGEVTAPFHRTLFGSSGRAQAWDGALRQIADRPLLGYGFGTEERVFVDRYYIFQGNRPENSYLGLGLQLGVAGVALFVALGLSLLVLLVQRLRRGGAELSSLAFGAVALAGFVLALAQSFVYSVGNVGTVTFWIAVFAFAASSREEAHG